ncbi:MAG: aspartate/glutamate racemase family protein [Desulfatiglandaceae bacterium]
MEGCISGGTTNYGQLVGILMMDSTIPRIPGDPGHAETFPFPVRYAVIRGFPFQDLVDIRKDNLQLIVKAAMDLEKEGVAFIAADCGLFSLFQKEISKAVNVPFLGSSLNLIPLIGNFLPDKKKIGLITGDTRLLKDEHLKAAGARRERLIIQGMEGCSEFRRVVIERGSELDVKEMKKGVLEVAKRFIGRPIGAVILECTNLITFRSDIQRLLGVPVYDAVSLIEFFAEGYRLKTFSSRYIGK